MWKKIKALLIVIMFVGYYITLIGLISKVWITNNVHDSFREDPLELWIAMAMVWVLVANAPKLITSKD